MLPALQSAAQTDPTSTDPSTGFRRSEPKEGDLMRGYVARKGDRWYAVVYEGLDPVTGKEKRSWHPAGTTRDEAVQTAARLAAELNGRNDEVRSLTFGAYLTYTWLPGKRITLAESTWDGYRRKIDRHILPTIGHLRIRRLRAHHLETLYDRMLHPTDDRGPLAPKTVLEVHLIIRGALNHAVKRGLVNRNVALVAHAPKLKAIPGWSRRHGQPNSCRRFCKLRQVTGCSLRSGFWHPPGCGAANCSGSAGTTST